MAKVYIVTAGDYDSFHISAIFSEEQFAKDYVSACEDRDRIDKIGEENMKIEEFEVSTSFKSL